MPKVLPLVLKLPRTNHGASTNFEGALTLTANVLQHVH